MALRLVQTGKRLVKETTRVSGPYDVYEFMKRYVDREVCENFWILALDTQHNIIRGEPIIITIGTLDTSVVHAREVFRPAILLGAAALILCHNHPSGDPTPSREDRDITDQLAQAGRIIGIPILDHLVVGDGRYLSFVEAGLLNS